MAEMTSKTLVEKLNPTCRRALEAAAGLCLSRTNYNVEIEHWLLKLLEQGDGDLSRACRHFGVDPGRLQRELTQVLDGLRTGNARTPAMSVEIIDLMREAWNLATLEYGDTRLRSGYLLAALLTDRSLRARARALPSLADVSPERLQQELKAAVEGSAEDAGTAPASPGGKPGAPSRTPALDQYTYDLTDRARKGELDPVIGRDTEIRQVIDVLTRRRQNNPILTGEAGVGKTAVVEGFALRVAAGDVPPPLRPVAVRVLDLALLQAGAGVKGEFENRLKSVISEVKSSPQPIILFIDEAHTLIGAGGSAGQGDAANLLKPALARGELRTIAATTWMEYKKYFEGDAALKRRFQLVKVGEPDVPLAVRMLRALTPALEGHHGVRILDEAVDDAVRLSHRYIPDRQLPDKCVSLLDTACARVALSQSAIPSALEDCRREIEYAEREMEILRREQAAGADHGPRLQDLQAQKQAGVERLAGLEKRWEQEKQLVERLRAVREKLERHAGADGPGAKPEDRLSPEGEAQARAELARERGELARLQGESPLVQPVVNRQQIAEVVSGWTGVPVGKMVVDEIKTVLALQEKLEERVVGQSHALSAVARRIQTARANLADPRRPLGVFMLVGPSGVGKTETAVALADILYGGERNMVVVNMSEYKEEYKVSQLLGSPRGYEGSQEGGVLTEAVRRKPYSIVLLDEVEKSHHSVQEIFYQVFDKGMLSDSRGVEVDFKNTIILLTSNVGTDTIMKLCADPETQPDAEGLAEALRPDLLKAFKPALLGRLTVVPYFPLGDEVLRRIVRMQLKQIEDRVREQHRAAFRCDDAVVETVASRCKEVESGARNIGHILTGTLLPGMAREFLGRMAEGRPVEQVRLGVNEAGQFVYDLSP